MGTTPENLSPLESSERLMETITKPMEWIDTLKAFLVTNPAAQGVLSSLRNLGI